MRKGARVELTSANVADFLRYRDTSTAGSNNGRMERQEAFITAYIEKLETMEQQDYFDMWDKIQEDKSLIKTNMSEQTFIDLVGNIKQYTYNSRTDNLAIEGTNGEEDGYDVFYPDMEKLKGLVVDTFFKSTGGVQ